MGDAHRSWLIRSLALLVVLAHPAQTQTLNPTGDSYEAERANAARNPYANDLGPDQVDISGYPAPYQDTYKRVFRWKCQRCHTLARALNSEYVEPVAADDAAKDAIIADWRAKHPELFKDPLIWQPAAHIWETYVKRMMAKPGCTIDVDEARAIWEFLSYDSVRRKTGSQAAEWARHRRQLLAKFKAAYPDRYRELYQTR